MQNTFGEHIAILVTLSSFAVLLIGALGIGLAVL